mmetsp:Transcript_22844/g.49741  ORF Transcript_22844/g.49741 Transcript_22844/m.49741 type:complete len:688 (-) Transcript_22844:901-2964(-)
MEMVETRSQAILHADMGTGDTTKITDPPPPMPDNTDSTSNSSISSYSNSNSNVNSNTKKTSEHARMGTSATAKTADPPPPMPDDNSLTSNGSTNSKKTSKHAGMGTSDTSKMTDPPPSPISNYITSTGNSSSNSNSNTKKTGAVSTREDILAKLEQARQKKNAAEQRLTQQRKQQQQHQQQQHQQQTMKSESTVTEGGQRSATMATKEDVSLSVTTAARTTSSTSTNRAREAQAALDRARSKLQGALENQKRALMMQQKQLQHQHHVTPHHVTPTTTRSTSWSRRNRLAGYHLPPISALVEPLIISGISQTGPPEMLRYPYYYSPAAAKSNTSKKNNEEEENRDSDDALLSTCSSSSCMAGGANRERLEPLQGGKEAIAASHLGEFKSGNIDADDSNNADCNYCESEREEQKNAKKEKDANSDGGGHGDTIGCHGNNGEAASNNNEKKLASITLAERKRQLQNEMMALKEKLEKKTLQQQQANNNGDSNSNSTAENVIDGNISNSGNKNEKTLTKQGLRKRKAEVQTVVDISYWKHFVSKQENLLEQVTTKLQSMDENFHSFPKQKKQKTLQGGTAMVTTASTSVATGNAITTTTATYQDYLRKRHAINVAIAQVQEDLQGLEARQQVVENGMAKGIVDVLGARKALHAETLKIERLKRQALQLETMEAQSVAKLRKSNNGSSVQIV